MHIDISGDDSITPQARTYAEYRLFSAVSQAFGSTRIGTASLVLRRAPRGRRRAGVECTVTVELPDGEVARRLRTSAAHPYAAINRAVDRLRLSAGPARRD